ncbi:MAG: hypothetical protein AB1810_04815 [Pseudomonadota bacterium]
MPLPTLTARLCLIVSLMLASACAHHRCEVLLTATEPDALIYQFNYPQRLAAFPGDEELPEAERYGRYEEQLNRYLARTLGEYRCALIQHSITIEFLGPGRNAYVRCDRPIPAQPERAAFQADGRPLYRYCIPPHDAARAVTPR